MTGAFVGRGEPLAFLADELRWAAAGASRIVWVEGVPGIGKTALVRRFLDDVNDGCVVAWAGGAEEERLLRYGLVEQLTSSLRPYRSATGVEGPTGDPLTVGAELLRVLGEVDGASVVVVDDLQLADAESASALLFALRRVQRESLLVVLVTRPDPAATLGEALDSNAVHGLLQHPLSQHPDLDGSPVDASHVLPDTRRPAAVDPSMLCRSVRNGLARELDTAGPRTGRVVLPPAGTEPAGSSPMPS
jgi:hypothetical protein